MPEGDTIYRAAARLRPAILNQQLIRFVAPRLSGASPQPGETILDVRSHGKHLLIDFSGGLTLRVHLRMSGSWHLYRTTTTNWKRKASTARVIIEVKDWVAVCFNAPDVALTRLDDAAVGHLGPDLCQPDPDLDEVCRRARRFSDPKRPIGDVTMDQRVACGIGNVYKSETLHSLAIDPTTPLHRLSDNTLQSVFVEAVRLLARNLAAPGGRTTVAEGYAVYGRADETCRRCGGTIVRIVQGGEQPRSTYYCPGCQALPS